jgi:hypothetical protein
VGSQCRLPHLVDAVVHRQSWILFTILPLLPLMTYRAEMLALAAERGITLCALDLEDYDELYLALTKGTDTVQPMTDLELDLLTTKGLKGVRSLLAPHSRRRLVTPVPSSCVSNRNPFFARPALNLYVHGLRVLRDLRDLRDLFWRHGREPCANFRMSVGV